MEMKVDDHDLPEFYVEDKWIEIDQDKYVDEDEQLEGNPDKVSFSGKVVKDIVQEKSHIVRLTELDSIAH